MAKNIKEITLYNFKAFYGENTIKLDGKNLLLYGENGSGKSSIYWALYTLLQSSTKNEEDIKKYFEPSGDEHLVNLNFTEPKVTIDPNDNARLYPIAESLRDDVKIEVILEDDTYFRLDCDGITTTNIDLLKGINRNSDFISHRLLINFYNFRNSKKINLWEVFVRDIFPFLKSDGGHSDKTLSEALKDLENNQPFIFRDPYFKLSRSQTLQTEFNNKVIIFNDDISYWLNEINTEVNRFYKDNFAESADKEIRISLHYEEKMYFDKVFPQYYKGRERWYGYVGFNNPKISIKIELQNEDGTFTEIAKPQSFFNEAKLTSIALSVRFTLLLDFIRPDFDGKFLALDDLLVSLDMSNRGKVLDVILDKFAPKYKVYLFTHEMEFFNYCKYKIGQKGQNNNWKIKEIYYDEEDLNPLIIDSVDDYLTKSKEYFKAKDYIASAVYLRKYIENFIKERIPDEFKKNIDNEYHNLDHYWNLFIERYKELSVTIPPKISQWFKQTKLVVLNPSAHANLSQQIYKTELQKAFEFREEIERIFPKNEQILVIAEKTQFVFKHPTENYIFEFYFKSDFLCANLNLNFKEILPNAVITTYSFNDIEFWDFTNNKKYDNTWIEKFEKYKPVKFEKMIENIGRILSLNITEDMFYKNTVLKNSTITLEEILTKFKI